MDIELFLLSSIGLMSRFCAKLLGKYQHCLYMPRLAFQQDIFLCCSKCSRLSKLKLKRNEVFSFSRPALPLSPLHTSLTPPLNTWSECMENHIAVTCNFRLLKSWIWFLHSGISVDRKGAGWRTKPEFSDQLFVLRGWRGGWVGWGHTLDLSGSCTIN